MSARKMTRGMLRSVTLKILKEQQGLCLVCMKPIDITVKGEAVLDHCHQTGHVRGVLHRSCNSALGKMDNALGRWAAKSMKYEDIMPILANVLSYYNMPKHEIIYHSHKSEDDKRAQRAARERARRAEQKARRVMKNV